ncbi:MAG: family 78 glycoside hydrolase catalytic domain [Eubacteriales bacterium]|nr:family 78 glycoside hydrolase catalytic domain [Eubacteriales bacterium]
MKKMNWKARWINPELICDPTLHKPASSLINTFHIPEIKPAVLYITAHGLYEVFLNGKRVGNFVLAPGSYNYKSHIAYQTYEVTDLLVVGENRVEVLLGDGWYRSVSGVDGDRNIYGEDVALFFQLEMEGKAVLVSDDSWKAANDGPILENDMQQGEIIDARRVYTNYHPVKVEDFSTDGLFDPACIPIVEKEHFTGTLLTTPAGKKVFDFGQNLAGYISFTVSNAKAGQKIILSHGETLDENGEFTQENFQDRKRHKEGGIRQQVIYTCKEGTNYYKTKFSIWGFRYALFEGDVDPKSICIEAVAVYSDMNETAAFTCSDERLNRLFRNCVWSMKSNFCDVPTDCPTRERAAWTGDMGIFAHTGLYLMDCYPVVRKWLGECRIAQYPDGKIANIAPANNNPGFFSKLLAGSVGWGDAVISVPYEMYKQTGNTEILAENYDMMKRWYAFLEQRAKQRPKNPIKLLKRNPYRRFTIETGIDYGEWCEPDIESTNAMRTPQGKVATAYFAYSGKLLSEIAAILEKDEDAKRYAALARNARKAYRFIALEDGRIRTDRQAELIRAIAFDLLDENEKKTAASDLNSLVIKNDYHLNTGFLSTPLLCPILAEYGYTDTAFRVLLQDTAPGWLYAVKKGATTIWESWNGIDEKGKPSESLNHYSKGAIAGWMLDGIAGIKVDVTARKPLTIAPTPNERIPHVKASLHTEWGTAVSEYTINNKEICFAITIPEGTDAIIQLPGKAAEIVGPGLHMYKEEYRNV